MENDVSVFDILGEEGITRMVAAFYRSVPNDDVLGPMYPEDDLEGAEKRLRDFLIYRLGGPPRYLEERGHPRLRMRHLPFAVTQQARDHWVAAMTHAMQQEGIPDSVQQALQPFFDQMATFLINRPE